MSANFQTNTASTQYSIFTESWVPYNYQIDGETTGIATDIVRLVMADAQLDYEINLIPWARAYKIVKDTPNTMLFLTKRTPQREAHFHWIGPVADISFHLYQLKQRPIISLDESTPLNNFRVGVKRGGSSEQRLINMGFVSGENLVAGGNFSQLMGMLFKERIDFIISEDASMRFRTRMTPYNYDELQINSVFSPKASFYLALNKAIPEATVMKLQQSLDKIKANGQIDAVFRRYLDQ